MKLTTEDTENTERELSTIHRWIERNHPDGFIDSLSFSQNLERVTDRWYERFDKLERERDQARKLAEEFHKDQTRLLMERDEARERVAELSAVVKGLRAIMRQEAQAAEKKIKEAHEIAFRALIQRDEILKAMAI